MCTYNAFEGKEARKRIIWELEFVSCLKHVKNPSYDLFEPVCVDIDKDVH